MPLSAVAARKLAQQKREGEQNSIIPSTKELDVTPPDANDVAVPEPKRQTKKRKRSKKQEPEVITSNEQVREVINKVELVEDGPLVPSDAATAAAEPHLELEDLPTDTSAYGPSDSDTQSDDEKPAKSKPRYPVLQLSTVNKDNVNFNDANEEAESSVAVTLAWGETLVAIGQYRLWVLEGSITIYGAVLHADGEKSYRIHAPSSHALPVIQAIQNPYAGGSKAKVVLVSENTGMRELATLSPLFDKLWNDAPPTSDVWDDPYTFRILWSSAEDTYERPLRALEDPDAWKSLAATLINTERAKPPVVLVCGPQGSGKSSLTRFLTNAFLCSRKYQAVAYLDIDPGQPEYRPSGDVSLCLLKEYNFGPSYCHPNCIEGQNMVPKAHHFGFSTPRDDTVHYLACVMDLYRTYQNQHTDCPLLINCSGWLLGSGLELLEDLIAAIKPSDIVYTSTQPLQEVDDVLAHSTLSVSSQLHQVTSIPNTDRAQRKSADLRAMLTMSYFHATGLTTGQLQWEPIPVNETPKETWSFAGTNPDIDAITAYTDYIIPKFVDLLIDMSILSVVAVYHDEHLAAELEHDRGQQDPDQEDTWHEFTPEPSYDDLDQNISSNPATPERALCRTEDELPYYFRGTGAYTPLDPVHSQTLGQVHLRAIDTENKLLRLVTPVSKQTLEEHRSKGAMIVLVKGRFYRPEWAVLEPYHVGVWREWNYEKTKARAAAAGLPKEGGLADEHDHMRFDAKAWADKTPYVTLATPENAEWRKMNKPWKVRRNLVTSGGMK